MKIPKFSAEASLVGHSRLVVGAKVERDGAKDLVLFPQMRRRPEDWCIPGCICVTGHNCPCCDWDPWPLPYPGPRSPKLPFLR